VKRREGPWRIALGALLLATALVVPLGFWLATGWASLKRAQAEIAAEAERSTHHDEATLATRLKSAGHTLRAKA